MDEHKPEGEAPADSQQPPEKPEGEAPADGQQPPADGQVPENAPDLLADLLSAGIITQAEYEAMIAA